MHKNAVEKSTPHFTTKSPRRQDKQRRAFYQPVDTALDRKLKEILDKISFTLLPPKVVTFKDPRENAAFVQNTANALNSLVFQFKVLLASVDAAEVTRKLLNDLVLTSLAVVENSLRARSSTHPDIYTVWYGCVLTLLSDKICFCDLDSALLELLRYNYHLFDEYAKSPQLCMRLRRINESTWNPCFRQQHFVLSFLYMLNVPSTSHKLLLALPLDKDCLHRVFYSSQKSDYPFAECPEKLQEQLAVSMASEAAKFFMLSKMKPFGQSPEHFLQMFVSAISCGLGSQSILKSYTLTMFLHHLDRHLRSACYGPFVSAGCPPQLPSSALVAFYRSHSRGMSLETLDTLRRTSFEAFTRCSVYDFSLGDLSSPFGNPLIRQYIIATGFKILSSASAVLNLSDMIRKIAYCCALERLPGLVCDLAAFVAAEQVQVDKKPSLLKFLQIAQHVAMNEFEVALDLAIDSTTCQEGTIKCLRLICVDALYPPAFRNWKSFVNLQEKLSKWELDNLPTKTERSSSLTTDDRLNQLLRIAVVNAAQIPALESSALPLVIQTCRNLPSIHDNPRIAMHTQPLASWTGCFNTLNENGGLFVAKLARKKGNYALATRLIETNSCVSKSAKLQMQKIKVLVARGLTESDNLDYARQSYGFIMASDELEVRARMFSTLACEEKYGIEVARLVTGNKDISTSELLNKALALNPKDEKAHLLKGRYFRQLALDKIQDATHSISDLDEPIRAKALRAVEWAVRDAKTSTEDRKTFVDLFDSLTVDAPEKKVDAVLEQILANDCAFKLVKSLVADIVEAMHSSMNSLSKYIESRNSLNKHSVLARCCLDLLQFCAILDKFKLRSVSVSLDRACKGNLSSWLFLIPQLLTGLDGVDLIFGLAKRLVAIDPHPIVLSLVKASFSSSAAMNLLSKIPNQSLVTSATTFVKELDRISVLPEERIHGFLTGLNADASKRFERLARTIARAKDEHEIAVVYDSSIKPLGVSLEAFVDRACVGYNSEAISELLGECRKMADLLKNPDYSKLGKDKLQLAAAMKSLISLFQNYFGANRRLDLKVLSPVLYTLDCSQIPITGAKSFISKLGTNVNVIHTKTKPKRISIIGCEGVEYPFLLKGQEDLHLDERMMQILTLVNMLLSENQYQTSTLTCRNYAVQPLGRQSGLIQWVSDTVPFYALYKKWTAQNIAEEQQQKRPTEMWAERIGRELEALNLSMKAPRRTWPAAVFGKVYDGLCAEVPSDLLTNEVLGCSLTPGDYLQRSASLTKSFAVMSIVGYVIGLGDRHLDNILLDFQSGHVVHIDYNVCFEKGRNLRVPELVPFRLSPNIIRQFGLGGVGGCFRETCVAVKDLLKGRRDDLMALVETLLGDCLIDWQGRTELGSIAKADISANLSVLASLVEAVDEAEFPTLVEELMEVAKLRELETTLDMRDALEKEEASLSMAIGEIFTNDLDVKRCLAEIEAAKSSMKSWANRHESALERLPSVISTLENLKKHGILSEAVSNTLGTYLQIVAPLKASLLAQDSFACWADVSDFLLLDTEAFPKKLADIQKLKAPAADQAALFLKALFWFQLQCGIQFKISGVVDRSQKAAPFQPSNLAREKSMLGYCYILSHVGARLVGLIKHVETGDPCQISSELLTGLSEIYDYCKSERRDIVLECLALVKKIELASVALLGEVFSENARRVISLMHGLTNNLLHYVLPFQRLQHLFVDVVKVPPRVCLSLSNLLQNYLETNDLNPTKKLDVEQLMLWSLFDRSFANIDDLHAQLTSAMAEIFPRGAGLGGVATEDDEGRNLISQLKLKFALQFIKVCAAFVKSNPVELSSHNGNNWKAYFDLNCYLDQQSGSAVLESLDRLLVEYAKEYVMKPLAKFTAKSIKKLTQELCASVPKIVKLTNSKVTVAKSGISFVDVYQKTQDRMEASGLLTEKDVLAFELFDEEASKHAWTATQGFLTERLGSIFDSVLARSRQTLQGLLYSCENSIDFGQVQLPPNLNSVRHALLKNLPEFIATLKNDDENRLNFLFKKEALSKAQVVDILESLVNFEAHRFPGRLASELEFENTQRIQRFEAHYKRIYPALQNAKTSLKVVRDRLLAASSKQTALIRSFGWASFMASVENIRRDFGRSEKCLSKILNLLKTLKALTDGQPNFQELNGELARALDFWINARTSIKVMADTYNPDIEAVDKDFITNAMSMLNNLEKMKEFRACLGRIVKFAGDFDAGKKEGEDNNELEDASETLETNRSELESLSQATAELLKKPEQLQQQHAVQQNVKELAPQAKKIALGVLARIREKLEGRDATWKSGAVSGHEALTAENQVDMLISVASNKELLSKLYEGWTSWI